MEKFPIEELEKIGLNNYEAVIVAAQHARYLNTKRLERLQMLEEDPSLDIDARKITAVALKDVLDGKVKFVRSDSM
ncbi:DNA-directed RNA polymerase subunit omega [candidate division GN15 bacterium]|jgi:DNA-directed RNA polymerase omega subunit|nr:DNA-directed RNA polymerase subunit omega [candidate division GN15 bacterium]